MEEENAGACVIMVFDRPNPISLGLPAEHVSKWATDTHAMEQTVARLNAQPQPGSPSNPAGSGWTASSRDARGGLRPYAYKMPYLTVNDLKKKSKGWREFLCTDFLSKSYGLPRSWLDAKRRLDSNAFEYLGNYRTAVFFIFAAVLYNRPLALIGGLALMRMWDWVEGDGASEDREGAMYRFKYLTAWILSWGVMFYSNVTLAVSYGCLISAVACVVHGVMRRTDAPKPCFRSSPRRREADLGGRRLPRGEEGGGRRRR